MTVFQRPRHQKVDAGSITRLKQYLSIVGVERLTSTWEGPVLPDPGKHTVSLACYTHLYEAGARAAHRAGNILPMAAALGTDHFRLLGQCAAACENLANALQSIVQFSEMTADYSGFYFSLSTDPRQVLFRFHLLDEKTKALPEYVPYAKASSLEVMLSFLEWLTGRALPVRALFLEETRITPQHRHKLGEVLTAVIETGQKDTALVFDPACLQYPVITDPLRLRAMLDAPMLELVTQSYRGKSVTSLVHSLLGHQYLSEGDVRPEAVARLLDMSYATLYRRLKSEGSAFQALNESVRHHLAMSFLQQQSMTIADIAIRLRYENPSNFIKAFRRWHGITPSVYRESHLTQ